MKTEYKTKKLSSTFLAAISCFILLLSISSCDFFTFSDLKEKENAANATEQLNSEKIYKLHITPRFGNENLYNQNSSRSAFPDFSSFDFSLYTFKATSSVLTQDATGTFNSVSGDISYSFSAPTSSEPVDFTFYICDSSGKELFYGTQQITYSTLGAEISKTVYFKTYNSSEVNGHIDLKVAVTSGYTLSCEIKNSSDESVCGNAGDPISVDSSGNITTVTEGIAPGTYKAYISVNKGSQIYDYIIQDINVWPDLTTNRWYLPDGTTNQTYNIEISENKIKLYVKGASPSGLYGSSGLTGVAQPLDTNSGAIMHPLASLSAAISKCTDSSTQYTIICDGSITGCNIGSQSTPNDCTITIRGGGNSSGYSRISTRGLTIYTNKAITLENIKISALTSTAIQYTSSATSADLSLKNCEITNNKMVGNVGGIMLNTANLHLQGKIVITGNAYRNNSSDTTGSPKNVVMNSPNLIIIDDPLDSSSRIGVTYSDLSPASFCPGFTTSCPGLDPKIIFSADFDEYEIKENSDDDPCLARLPLYAEVNDRRYYTLSATVNAIISTTTGQEVTVKLCSPVTAQDLGNSTTEGTIVNALYTLSELSSENEGIINLELDTNVEIELSDEYNSEMFKNCSCLKSINVEGIKTVNLTSMKYMFANCSGFEELDLTGFNGETLINMEGMFSGCTGLKNIEATFSTQNVTNMKELFMSCEALEEYYFGFSSQNVTDMSNMFANCISLISIDLTGMSTSSVTNYSEMFASCSDLEAIYVLPEKFVMKEEPITSTNMFSGCNNLTGARGTTIAGKPVDNTYARIDEGESKPGYFTHCHYASIDRGTGTIYYGYLPGLLNEITGTYCSGRDITLTIYPRCTVDDFGNSSTQNTIAYAIKYTSANSIKLVVPKETYLKLNANSSGLFEGCEKIISADLSGFDTSDVSNMQAMFRDCSSLKTLDLSSFDTTSVQNTATMFYNDNVLTTVYVSNTFNTSSISDDTSMFTNCTSIKGGNGTTYSDAFDDKTYARIDSNSTPGYFTSVMDKPLDVTENNIDEVFANLHSGTNIIRINGSLSTDYIKALRTAIQGTSYNIALDFTNITNTSYTLSSANGTSGGNTKGDSFKGYGNIIKIIISGNHKITFGKEAFAGCTNLECIKFVDSFNNQNDTITDGYAPFANCNKLFTIDFTECTNVVFNAQIFINNENLSPYQNTVTQNVLFGSKLSSLIIKDTSYFHDTNFKFKYSGNSTRWPQLIQNRLGTQRENLKCYCVEDGKTLTMDSTGIWG